MTQYGEFRVRSFWVSPEKRVSIACKVGSPDDVMTEDELIAKYGDWAVGVSATPSERPDDVDDEDPLPDGVSSLAAVRLSKHVPGTPFTPEEIAPGLTDPTNVDAAGEIAAILNAFQDRVIGPGTGPRPGPRPLG